MSKVDGSNMRFVTQRHQAKANWKEHKANITGKKPSTGTQITSRTNWDYRQAKCQLYVPRETAQNEEVQMYRLQPMCVVYTESSWVCTF
jgi:hypothetical protein